MADYIATIRGGRMTGPEFREWRKRLGLTQARAAEVLGCGKRRVEALDRADALAPETAFACRWLEAHPEDATPPQPTPRTPD